MRNMFYFQAYFSIIFRMMLINSSLFSISSCTIIQKDYNSSQLTAEYYLSELNNTQYPQDHTEDFYQVTNLKNQSNICAFCMTSDSWKYSMNTTNLTSGVPTIYIIIVSHFHQNIPTNYSILKQFHNFCEDLINQPKYQKMSDTKRKQYRKSTDAFVEQKIPLDDEKDLNSPSYIPIHKILEVFPKFHDLILDNIPKIWISLIKVNCSNASNISSNSHHQQKQYQKNLLLLVRCKNGQNIRHLSLYCYTSYHPDKLNLSYVSQCINFYLSIKSKRNSLQSSDDVYTSQFLKCKISLIQSEVEKRSELQVLPMRTECAFSLCSLYTQLLKERKQMNSLQNITKNISIVQPVDTVNRLPRDESIGRIRQKRTSNIETKGIYPSMDLQLLPPRNLQIVPLSFGSLNISWIPAQRNEQFITHYELVLFSLNELSDHPTGHCPRRQTRYNFTNQFVYHVPKALQNHQLIINVTAPADYAIITGLPPDNFYRVLLFAVGNSLRSPPATMPSSPRVPALSPETAPENVKVTLRGTQSAKISWSPPNDIDCTGELMNYVININSSRLIEPIVVKVPRSRRSHVIDNLIPGSIYTVQISATNRGGLGVPSKVVHFQTGGELPKIDPDELEGMEMTDSTLEFNMEHQNVDFFEDKIKANEWVDSVQQSGGSPVYVLPSRIHNLRATPTQTSIKLKWSTALRQINMESETHLFDNVDYEYTSLIDPRHLIPVPMKSETRDKDTTGLLPLGTKYVIRWGDMHPGPSEDIVRGDQTQYTIENLRPGTIYYIRVISVTESGDGPAAYTVVMTLDSSTATKPTNHGLLIPVNLVVRQLGSTWARVGWDIPHVPQSVKMMVGGFQIKYYPVKSNIDQELQEKDTEDMLATSEQFTEKSVKDKNYEMKLINMTLSSNQLHTEHFDIMLRNLKPATQYEFGVRMLHGETVAERSNSDDSDKTVKTYFWSMVQGFETFGKSPKDAPTNLRLSKLKLNNKLHKKLQLLDFSSVTNWVADTSTTTASSDQEYSSTPLHTSASHDEDHPTSRFSVTMLIKWDPPSYPNGRILGSTLYLTTNFKQSARKWVERSVNGGSTEAGLLRMQPSTLYFVRIIARNQHGRSPYSSIVAFYTPNADGNGGGIVKFTKDYYNLHDIHEPMDRIMPFLSENELNTIKHLNSESKKMIESENIHWIILGGVLSGALVIMIIITLVLLSRCRKTKTSSSLTKRSSNRSPYNLSSYSSCHQHEISTHGHECLQKNPSFHVNETCVNTNCMGSCSPAETIAAGSTSGSMGVCTGHSITNEQFNQNVCINCYPQHNSTCTHSDFNAKKINETVPLLTSNHCNCVTSINTTSPINWLPNMSGFNIGISGGGYFEDRHSTSAESDIDANHSIKIINNCHENGRNWGNNTGCSKFASNKQWSIENVESMNSSAQREMTVSYLASGIQNPINCHTSYCQQQSRNMGNLSPYKTTPPPHPPPISNLQVSYCKNVNNLQGNFIRSREFRGNQLNKMIGEHGLTGSGSLTDEVTTSSPGSSATGRTQGYLNQISSSPTNTSLNFKKYNRVIGKYDDDDDDDNDDKMMMMMMNDINCNRDGNFRNSENKYDVHGGRQKLTVNRSVDQQSISPIQPRKYHGNKSQISSDNQNERCQNIGLGITSRNNALSSDYASQQSSLSNKSSGSSVNHGFSPEKHVNYSAKVPVIDINTNNHNVGASFVLDRVPTPEPQHRTGPFARLMQYNLPDQAVNRLQIQDLDGYLSGKVEIKSKVIHSPSLTKRTTLTSTATTDVTAPETIDQNVFSPESDDNSEFTKRDRTPETPDSISEQEMMRGFSTEELNQEMANLEGLMKNLSEITQNEFTC
ncbi:unnamed protein product [Heterobilharzia americana]|nr:unnamed protein product [Heterobilharzia americana]